ncbi:MAG: dienelactone hydrolase family protein [Bacteroidetes bacterium]|nr:dienelactone hydrolase family protein [Bacteroidota bacterium]
MFRLFTFLICVFSSIMNVTSANALAPVVQKITFPAPDALLVTADLYFVNDTLPYMILCHQAGYSRGEYLETAAKFCRLGYNCIAVDQRSGNEVNGVKNETAVLTTQKKKTTGYLDAEKDILAAIDYAYTKSGKKVILVGSSYSASLALKIATTNQKIQAVMAFSPGEYFGNDLKLKKAIANLAVPVFVTSTKEEEAAVAALISDVKSKIKKQYTPPASKGIHGSSCLWKTNQGYQDYWIEILLFMKNAK